MPVPPKDGNPCIFSLPLNGSTYIAAATEHFVNGGDAQLLPQPPCSPDLFHFDFFLFPELKQQAKSVMFESAKDVCGMFTRALEDMLYNQSGLRSGTSVLNAWYCA